MKARILHSLTALAGAFALTLSTGALADGGRWHDGGRGWGHEKHAYKHHYKHHHKHHYAGPTRVIIREAPVVYERRVYYERPYYERTYYRPYYDEPRVSFSFTVPLR